LAAARRVIVLADSTKLNRSVFAHIVALDQVNILVHGCGPSGRFSQRLAEYGSRLSSLIDPERLPDWRSQDRRVGQEILRRKL